MEMIYLQGGPGNGRSFEWNGDDWCRWHDDRPMSATRGIAEVDDPSLLASPNGYLYRRSAGNNRSIFVYQP